MRTFKGLAGVLCLALCAWAGDDGKGKSNDNESEDNGKVVHGTRETRDAHAATGSATATVPIAYHNGPVLLGTTNIYYIWYGAWNDNSPTILQNLAQTIGGSPYFNINTTYYSGAANPKYVSNSVAWGGYTTDNYSLGKNLTDANIRTIVSSAIGNGRLPKDTNGVYFVLAASDVKETSGFCTQYCGWHTYGTIGGSNIKYAFIGNPATQCPRSCSEQTVSSPNGNIGADAMASIIAHELEETVTDPNLNAWYDRNGEENGDKCAWTFGATSPAPNGSLKNITLGGLNYLIQQNWVATTSVCSMQH